jgi:hypothetical protein
MMVVYSWKFAESGGAWSGFLDESKIIFCALHVGEVGNCRFKMSFWQNSKMTMEIFQNFEKTRKHLKKSDALVGRVNTFIILHTK